MGCITSLLNHGLTNNIAKWGDRIMIFVAFNIGLYNGYYLSNLYH